MPTLTLRTTADAYAKNDTFGSGSSANTGAGKDWHLPIGQAVGYKYRSYLKFGGITSAGITDSSGTTVAWSDIASIDSALLSLTTTAKTNGTVGGYSRVSHLIDGFGTDQWNGTSNMVVYRAISSWSEGTYGNNETSSTTNALNWGNLPFVDGSYISKDINNTRPSSPTTFTTQISSFVNNWKPAAYGGSGASNYGILLFHNGEATNANSAEFYSIEATTLGGGTLSANYAPTLTITYTAAIAPVPTVSVTTPNGSNASGLGTISNLSDAQIWTAETDYAQTTLGWTAAPSAGQTIGGWRLRVYTSAARTTTIFDTGTITNSAHLNDTSYTTTPISSNPSWITGTGWQTGYNGFINGTVYYYDVYVIDSGGYAATSSAGSFKVRWGQGIYEYDTGSGFATTSGWALEYDVPQIGTQVGAIYRVSGSQTQAQVTNMSGNGTTVTVTCASGHSFLAGDVVTITAVAPNTYNIANQTVLATGLTSTAFQVTNSLAASPAYVTNTVGYATLVSYLSAAANITAVSGNGTTVTYTASNAFISGQRVTITGCTTTAYNLSNVLIATASSTQFTVTNSATGATSSGGVATMHGRRGTNAAITGATASGTAITYNSPTHTFVAGQSVNITGITPTSFNLSNAVVASVVAGTSFTIASTVTGTYTKGGNAQSALYANLSDIEGHNRYLLAHVRTSVDNGSTNKPIINNIYLSYLSSLQIPDNWFAASNTTYYLDSDNRRFGTKAAKMEVTTSSDGFIYPNRGISPSDIAVVANTRYSFSAYVKFTKPSGENNISLRVYPAGTTTPSSVTPLANSGSHTLFPADSESWRRLSVTFTTGGSTSYVRPMIYMANVAGSVTDFAWIDGVLFEEGTVVRSWTPGFVTSGVTFEGGGLNIDTANGGVLRLRGSSGGSRDEVTVGASGLNFGGLTSPVSLYSGSASTLNVTGDLSATGLISTTDKISSSNAGGKTTLALTSTGSDTGLTIGGDNANLYRSAANTLKTDGSLTVNGTITGAGETVNLVHGVTLQRTTNLTMNTSTDASATAVVWSSIVDESSLYDYWSSGSTITLPETGWYSITCHLLFGTGASYAARLYCIVSGVIVAETETQAGSNTTSDTLVLSTIVHAAATNTVVFRASASSSSKVITGSGRSRCSVIYLGNDT